MDKNIRKWFCSMGESRTLLAPTGEDEIIFTPRPGDPDELNLVVRRLEQSSAKRRLVPELPSSASCEL